MNPHDLIGIQTALIQDNNNPNKTMKKTILAVLAMGALSCALFSQQAQADPITGSIAMGGTVALNGPINTATQVNHWFAVGTLNDGFSTVFGVSGDLASTDKRVRRGRDGATLGLRFRRASGGAVERWGFHVRSGFVDYCHSSSRFP